MALDRAFDDEASDAGPERHPQRRGSGGDAAAARGEQVESRTRAECYEALRVADGGSAQTNENQRQEDSGTDHRPGAQTERSGWSRVEAEDRPVPDAIRVSPERASHILDGDEYGGGHRHGTGRPGKTEFPASWDDKKVVAAALDIARKPDQQPVHQDHNNRWLCTGTRDGVEVSVIVLPGGEVWTAWPEEGSPGVIRNPRKGRS
jgi:Bacterial EndoU nuclease